MAQIGRRERAAELGGGDALQAERGALGDALRRGLISEHVYTELVTDIDHRLEALNLIQTIALGIDL